MVDLPIFIQRQKTQRLKHGYATRSEDVVEKRQRMPKPSYGSHCCTESSGLHISESSIDSESFDHSESSEDFESDDHCEISNVVCIPRNYDTCVAIQRSLTHTSASAPNATLMHRDGLLSLKELQSQDAAN